MYTLVFICIYRYNLIQKNPLVFYIITSDKESVAMKIGRYFFFPFFFGILLSSTCTACTSPAVSSAEVSESSEKIPEHITLMTNIHSAYSLENYLKKQYPQIQIDILSYPEEQYYTVLKSRLSTQNAADIIDVQLDYAGPNGVKELGPAGYLYPLYEISENYPASNDENLLIADNFVYGKAWQRMTLGITYNKSLFEKYNLSYPQCWKDFLGCCQKLKNHGIQPLVIEGHNISSFQYPLYQIAANQLYPDFPDYDSRLRAGTARFTDPGTWDHIFETYLTLFEQDYISSEALDYNIEEASQMLLDGKAAMMFDTSLNYNAYINTDSLKNTFYFAPFPANSKGKQLYVCESLVGGFGICAASPHAEFLRDALINYNSNLQQYNYLKGAAFSEKEYADLPTFPFCNQEWPNEVEIVMEYQLSAYLSGVSHNISDITAAMQEELEK